MKYLAIASALVMLLAASVSAATLYVPSQYSTIQTGINASSNGDTILVADGTYTGSGNRNLDFGGRAIVVKSENGPDHCKINCQNSGRGAYFHSGESNSAILEGFTITAGSNTYGGAIYIVNSSPTIKRCILWNNNGYLGGSINIANGSPIIAHCTLVQNAATQGGAIYATNTSMIINSCIVVNNTASG